MIKSLQLPKLLQRFCIIATRIWIHPEMGKCIYFTKTLFRSITITKISVRKCEHLDKILLLCTLCKIDLHELEQTGRPLVKV